jgi:photosystem II stability/assembly factor-like uncharacterized protein
MKLKRRFISMLLFCVTAASQLLSQWTSLNGPSGGFVHALAVDGATVYAGTDANGLYRSTNDGLSWSSVKPGPSTTSVITLAVFRSGTSGTVSIFAGTGSGGVFRSTDHGANWMDVRLPTSGGTVMSFASIDSMDRTIVLAGMGGAGVYRSTDNGTTWNAANTGLGVPIAINALMSVTDSTGAVKVFAGANGPNGGIFVSTNNGLTWATSNAGIAGNYVYSLATMGTAFFAGTNQGTVYRSVDNGKTWTKASTGITSGDIVRSLVAVGSTLYATTDGQGVYRTTNNGSTWSAIMTGHTDAFGAALTLNNAGTTLLSGTRTGIFRTTDGGTNWTASNSGLSYLSVNTLAFSADGVVLYAGTDGGGVCSSTDNGATWQAPNIGLKQSNGNTASVYAVTVMGTTVFAGTNGEGSVYRSSDRGATWTGSQSGLAGKTMRSLFVHGTTLLAGRSGGGVFRSTDNGSTWLESDAGLPSLAGVSAFVNIGAIVFAGTYGSGVYQSADTGKHWTSVTPAPPFPNWINALTVSSTNRLYAGMQSSGVYVTSDNGVNWSAANSGLTQHATVNALAIFGEGVYAGTEGDSMYVSTNNGATWAHSNSGLTSSIVNAFTVGPTGSLARFLYAGTGSGGVFRTTESMSFRPRVFLSNPITASVGTPFFVEIRIGEPTPVSRLYGISFKVKSDKPTCTYVDGSAAVGSFPDAGVLTYFRMADPQTVDVAVSKTTAPGMSGGGLLTKTQFVSSVGGRVTFTLEGLKAIDENGVPIELDTVGITITFGGPVAKPVGIGPYQLGKPFWVQVQVGGPDTIRNLYGVSMKLRSSRSTCSYVDGSAVAGTLLGTTPLTMFKKVDAQTVDIAVTKIAAPGITGNGIVAKTQFTSATTEGVTFSLSDITAINQSGIPILLGAETLTIASVATGVEASESVPTEFRLMQNFPNPFNPSTTIRFNLPVRSFVSLKVFDLLGREISTLVSQELGAGTFSACWEPTVPSGIYIYQLRAGEFLQTKRMVVVK